MNELRLVAWEITKRCNLKCLHCRGSSNLEALDGPSKERSFQILDQIKEVGKPVIILTGGEPLLREDLFDIAEYGSSIGMRMVLATNGTLLNRENVRKIKDSGIKRVSISIDSANEKEHDEFRNVEGAFRKAIDGTRILKEEGVEFQINTTVTKRNLNQIGRIMDMAIGLGAAAYHIFLLVPTGRGRMLSKEVVEKEEYEKFLLWLSKKSQSIPIHIKPTCSPQYYRILRQKKIEFKGHGLDSVTRGCLGGISFCFISSDEKIQPCGYLEIECGNLKEKSFKEIWESSPIFNSLRNFSLYKGKCGRCEYIRFCGGCRARAYEIKGDYLEEDPICYYEPKGNRQN